MEEKEVSTETVLQTVNIEELRKSQFKVPKPVYILLLLLLAYGAWNFAFPSGDWRYRLTVTIETPEGLKVGSAVREVDAHSGTRNFTMPGSINLRGEAVAVDLGPRGILFALNSGTTWDGDGNHLFFASFGKTAGLLSPDGIREFKSANKSGKVIANGFPNFVRFKNLTDRQSVEKVNPLNMEPTFGEGVELRGLTIEVTDDPVTWNIQELLSWIPERTSFYTSRDSEWPPSITAFSSGRGE